MSICAVNARIPGSQNYVRISVKMSESRLSNNISGHLFNNYCFIFFMLNSISHGSLLMHAYILYWIIRFKTSNSSSHVSYVCVFVCV